MKRERARALWGSLLARLDAAPPKDAAEFVRTLQRWVIEHAPRLRDGLEASGIERLLRLSPAEYALTGVELPFDADNLRAASPGGVAEMCMSVQRLLWRSFHAPSGRGCSQCEQELHFARVVGSGAVVLECMQSGHQEDLDGRPIAAVVTAPATTAEIARGTA